MSEEPIQGEFQTTMNIVAGLLDSMFNGEANGEDRTVSFTLLVTEMGSGDRPVNYISNSRHEDVIEMMRSILKRFDGEAG